MTEEQKLCPTISVNEDENLQEQGFLKLKRNDIQEARYLPLRFGGTFTGIGNVSDLTIEMGNCSDGKKKDAMNVGMSRNRIENFDGPCVWMLKSLRMMRALC